jgi:hypothetical protein
MPVYVLMLNPLVMTIDNGLTDIRLTPASAIVTLFAYAYDVTVILTSTNDIQKLHAIIRTNENATGAVLNKAKSKVLPVGDWEMSVDVMDIPYHRSPKLKFWASHTRRQSPASSAVHGLPLPGT